MFTKTITVKNQLIQVRVTRMVGLSTNIVYSIIVVSLWLKLSSILSDLLYGCIQLIAFPGITDTRRMIVLHIQCILYGVECDGRLYPFLSINSVDLEDHI